MDRTSLTAGALVVAVLAPLQAGDDQTTVPESPPESSVVTTPARQAFDDVLSWLESPETVDIDRFAPEFLEFVPAEELDLVLEQLRSKFEVLSVAEPTPNRLVAVIRAPALTLEVQLAVDASGLISELLFAPGQAQRPESLDDVAAQVDGLGAQSGLLVASVGDGGVCRPIVDLRSDVDLPLGSVFKLYVLGAIATAVAEGVVAWDQPVTIRDELDSLPSGDTQDEPAGSTLTVEQLAGAMIAISDNTATDHLIELVGRDRVEAALAAYGHSDPSTTLPFLTTREAFVLKLDDSLRARYRDASVDERRRLLAEIAERPLPAVDSAVVAQWNEPRDVTAIEWFASPRDICRALVALDDLGDDPAQAAVRRIMTANQDLYQSERQFSRVLSKGGSEPGVHFEAFLVATPAGERYAVIGGAADETEPIDPTLSAILFSALELLPS